MAICLPVWHSQCKEPGLLFCRVWCSDELAVSGVASPKIWEGPKNLVEAKMLDFRRITLFFWKNASQSTKWLYFLKFFWGRPVWPPLTTPMLAVHSCPLLGLQRQVAKFARGLFYSCFLFHNNNKAQNLQRFTSSWGSRRIAGCNCLNARHLDR